MEQTFRSRNRLETNIHERDDILLTRNATRTLFDPWFISSGMAKDYDNH